MDRRTDRFRPIFWALLLLMPLRLAAAPGEGAAPPWPTLAEQLAGDCIAPDSALAKLVADNQEFWMLRADEREDSLRIPFWLRVLYRKEHRGPDFTFSADDPTKGYPHVLREGYRKLLANQNDPGVILRAAEEDPAWVTFPAFGAQPPPSPEAAIGANLSMSGTQSTRRNESCVQVNYWNPNLILSASNESANPQGQFYSTDGGATWQRVDLPILSGDTYHSDPWVDWTSDGTAWTCTMGCKSSKAYLRLYQSTDNGASWVFHSTISGTQSGVDKQMGWVDHSTCSPYVNQMYFLWHNGNPAYVNVLPPGGSFGTPVQLSGAESTGTCIGADIKTNAYGDVFAFWPTTTNRRLVLRKSTDGGASWSSALVVWTMYDAYDIGIPAMAGRRAMVYVTSGAYRTPTRNEVYLAWMDLSGETGCTAAGNEPNTTVTSTCKTRIWFSRSADGGATWSAPVKINNQASKNDQFSPWMAVDETTGAIGIAYQDTVADTGRLKSDVWFQSSADGGVTWTSAQKVTTAMTDETGSGADSTGMQYGDYNGLAGYAGTFFPSWTDRRSGSLEEIWTAKITDCIPPTAPSAPTFSAVTCNALTVTWPAASGATAYDLYRTTGTCTGAAALLAAGTLGTSFADSGLSANTTYSYYVTAKSGSCARLACGACATATTATSCASGPLRVPYGVTPTKILKNNAAATDVTVTWDPTNCPSSDYHIVWGYGGDVATLAGSTPTVSGGKCDIGTSGSLANWNSGVPDPANDPGAGKFVWFLVVGDNNGTTEGSWGLTSAGGERGGTAASSQCTCATKSISGSCGTT